MLIQVLSDIHTEAHKGPVVERRNLVGDVIVMAGDICDSSSFIAPELPTDVPVIHVLGNHEYYNHSFSQNRINALQQEWIANERPNVKILENQSLVVNGVRFLGTTLWTDLLTEHGEFQGYNCRRGMNDFFVISGMSIASWLAANTVAKQWLKTQLETPFDGKTVVVTHHAPSYRSNAAVFANSDIRAGFCTSLDDMIRKYSDSIALWVHGHTHSQQDYNIGSTRVVCNPHGYFAENPRFSKKFLIEV